MAAWRTRAVGPKSGGDEISSLMTSQESSSWQNSKESHDDLKKEQKIYFMLQSDKSSGSECHGNIGRAINLHGESAPHGQF